MADGIGPVTAAITARTRARAGFGSVAITISSTFLCREHFLQL